MARNNRQTAAPTLLGISDAANKLGVCENTLRKWADQGRVASFRDSKNRRLFDAATISTYKQAGDAQHST